MKLGSDYFSSIISQHGVKELLKNFTEGTNFNQMLVRAFQDVLLKQEHAYLKNFYMIIPALTINFIETLRISKDKMDKTLREGSRQVAYFSDDGFMVGLAYILAIFLISLLLIRI